MDCYPLVALSAGARPAWALACCGTLSSPAASRSTRGRGEGLGGATAWAERGGQKISAAEWGHPMVSQWTPSSFNLGTVLFATCGLFCLATLFFGTKGGYYDSDDYDGNGTAH